MSDHIFCDGNTRLLATVDPGSHRLHLTMETWEWSYCEVGADGWWEPLGCVSLSGDQMVGFLDVLDELLVEVKP